MTAPEYETDGAVTTGLVSVDPEELVSLPQAERVKMPSNDIGLEAVFLNPLEAKQVFCEFLSKLFWTSCLALKLLSIL